MCFRVDGIYVFIHLHSTTYPAHMLIRLQVCGLPLARRGPAVAVRTRDKEDKRERGNREQR